MKILAIHGSPRTIRSTTRRLAGLVLEGAAEVGAETEIVDLADLRITPCTACEGCTFNGICVYEDDLSALLARMNEADAIVFASPVYFDSITGQMKIFFDRLADAIHYQALAGKVGCSVATTHGSGGDETTTYMDHLLNYLGIVSIGRIHVATGGDAGAVDVVEQDAGALGRRLVSAIADGFSDPAQEASIVENRSDFRAIVLENRDLRTDDYERWVRRGWIP
ncbi:MAG: NAD(P)H dehydrogenase (quinone) [Methanoregula sp. SKADARSKE-2]|nr:MAG: NAD(P)H dehydrogenase (quinone) [Methanoregula sp. SKADARSKE-2]